MDLVGACCAPRLYLRLEGMGRSDLFNPGTCRPRALHKHARGHSGLSYSNEYVSWISAWSCFQASLRALCVLTRYPVRYTSYLGH